jgi:hypothetical protein
MRRTSSFSTDGEFGGRVSSSDARKECKTDFIESTFRMLRFVLNELLETMKVLRSAVTDGLELQLKSTMIAEFKKESLRSRVDRFEKELGQIERRFGKETGSLSTQHNSDDCGSEGVMSEFANICGCPEDVEHGMSLTTAKTERQRKELETLKSSVSKVIPPDIIGGFKNRESLYVTVPGIDPLKGGIMSYLTTACGGNVCDRQRVHVFSDSVHEDFKRCNPQHAADLSSNSYFFSSSGSNQSFGYDLKYNQSISPTHYAIRTHSESGAGGHHPKSWVVEVTNDRSNNNSWIEIDRRQNNEDLNGKGVVQTFECSNPPRGEFRYIRIRQTDVNHYGDHYLAFAAFEIFGQLRIKESVPL